MQIHTFGYGTMKACSWLGFQSNDRQNLQCVELSGYKEITLTDHFKCTSTSACPNFYLRIQNVTSLYKCAGKHWLLQIVYLAFRYIYT